MYRVVSAFDTLARPIALSSVERSLNLWKKKCFQSFMLIRVASKRLYG